MGLTWMDVGIVVGAVLVLRAITGRWNPLVVILLSPLVFVVRILLTWLKRARPCEEQR